MYIYICLYIYICVYTYTYAYPFHPVATGMHQFSCMDQAPIETYRYAFLDV